MKYKLGDEVIRTSLGGRGQRATVLEAISAMLYKVRLSGEAKEQNWHALHFRLDKTLPPMPVPMPAMPVPMPAMPPAIGIGCKVTHTAHKHGVLVGVIVGEDKSEGMSRWTMAYDSGKKGSWLKKYTILYDCEKEHFNQSEEDNTMKLEIIDYTTINGIKTDEISTNSYINLISDAEAEITRLKSLQEGSKAIANSAVVTTAIKALTEGVERCVVLMDKNA